MVARSLGELQPWRGEYISVNEKTQITHTIQQTISFTNPFLKYSWKMSVLKPKNISRREFERRLFACNDIYICKPEKKPGRGNLTLAQILFLEKIFNSFPHPSTALKRRIGKDCGLSLYHVSKWFKNRDINLATIQIMPQYTAHFWRYILAETWISQILWKKTVNFYSINYRINVLKLKQQQKMRLLI